MEALKRWGQGRIRLGATHTLCQYLLPTVLREFRDCFPRCEIHIESGDTGDLLAKMEEAQLDLVLGLGGRTPSWARFQPIFKDELVFVVSSQHPWAMKDYIPVEEIGSESFLIYAKKSQTYRLIRDHFESMGVKLRTTLNLGAMEAIKEMARVGIGVGIVSPWVAKKELERGQLVQVPIRNEPIVREWGILSHESKKLSLVEDAFVGICEVTARILNTNQATTKPKEKEPAAQSGPLSDVDVHGQGVAQSDQEARVVWDDFEKSLITSLKTVASAQLAKKLVSEASAAAGITNTTRLITIEQATEVALGLGEQVPNAARRNLVQKELKVLLEKYS